MDMLPFDQVIGRSPLLSDEAKTLLLENSNEIPEQEKLLLMTRLLEYEKKILVGAESFLSALKGEDG